MESVKRKDFAYFRGIIEQVREKNLENADTVSKCDDFDVLIDWCEEVNEYLTSDIISCIDDLESSVESLRGAIPQEWE